MKRAATSKPPISPPAGKKKAASGTTATAVSNFFTPSSQKDAPVWKIVEGSMVAGYYKQKSLPDRHLKSSSAAANSGGTPSSSSAKASSSKVSKTTKVSSSKVTRRATTVSSTEVSITTEVTADGDGTVGEPFRIAAFDFDSNLVNTKSGNKFAKDASDWVWWHSSVPAKLKQLHEEGYRLVIFTNQNGVKLKSGKNEKRLDEYKGRITQVCTALELPFLTYAATETDCYRKPRTGMFEELLLDIGGNDAMNLDLENSVFVGDAAGRKGDFSASDRMFAENIGIPFQTPEEFFLGKPAEPYTLPLNPNTFISASSDKSRDSSVSPAFSKQNPVELVVIVGSPAAGKSTYYFTYLEPLGYERINQDKLKTREKCIKVASEQLSNGNSVAIDNTNPDVEVRAVWKELAAKYEAAFRCIYLATPESVCAHNNCFRAFGKNANPEERSLVPGMGFNFFKKRFVEPTLKEGFLDITKVDFQFRGDKEQMQEWTKHWSS